MKTLKNGNNPDNEAAARKELGVRGFKPGVINAPTESLDDPNFDVSSPLPEDEDDAEQKPDINTPGFEDIDEIFFTNHD